MLIKPHGKNYLFWIPVSLRTSMLEDFTWRKQKCMPVCFNFIILNTYVNPRKEYANSVKIYLDIQKDVNIRIIQKEWKKAKLKNFQSLLEYNSSK